METALCLYGHFRCFDQCWDELRDYLIVPNKISHIFLQAWTDSMGVFEHPTLAENPLTHPGFNTNSSGVSREFLHAVCDKLQPRLVYFDHYALHDDRFTAMVNSLEAWHHPSKSHRPKGTLSQVWARCASLALARQWEVKRSNPFDRIICTRWDIGYQKPIDLNGLDPTHVTMDGMYGPDIISDAWACGPSAAMSLWGQQFSAIDDLTAAGSMNLGPHEWLRAHFDQFGITWTNRSDLGIWIRR